MCAFEPYADQLFSSQTTTSSELEVSTVALMGLLSVVNHLSLPVP